MASELPSILTEDDAGDVADLFARCVGYFMLQDGEPPTFADALDLFRDVPENKLPADQAVLGWHAGRRLVAVGAILRDYPRDGVWYLGFMIVDPSVRSQGIGRSFHDKIKRWAADRGAQELRLAVLEANAMALKFWHSLGYGELRRVGPDIFKSRSHHRVELCRTIDGNPVGSPTS